MEGVWRRDAVHDGLFRALDSDRVARRPGGMLEDGLDVPGGEGAAIVEQDLRHWRGFCRM